MKTPIFFTGSGTSNVSASADRYAPFAGGGPLANLWATPSAGLITGASRAPCAGTISMLRTRFPTALTQGSYVVTLMRGATLAAMAATGLSATITSAGLIANNLADTVTVAEGDYLAWRATPAGTPEAQSGAVQIACMFEAATAGRSPIFTSIAGGTAANAAPLGTGGSTSGTEATNMSVMPLAGNLTKLYARIQTAPGTGNSRTMTLRRGTAVGALADTAFTVTFGATETEKVLDLTSSPLALAAGDILSIAQGISGTPASAGMTLAFEFVPATAGEAPLLGVWGGTISSTATRYGTISGFTGTGEATEASVGQIVPGAMTVKRMRYDLTTAPGAGKSRTATFRKNASDTALAVALADATSGVATSDVTLAGGDLIDVATVPAGSPASSGWGGASAVAVMSSAPQPVAFSSRDKAGQTFDGIRNASKVAVGGSYSGTPTSVQVRLVDGAGVEVSPWVAAASQGGGAYAHTFTGVAVGGPYYHQVRDNSGAATASVADLYVGAVVVLWGQSQMQKLYTADTAGLTPPNGMQVRVLSCSNINDVTNASSIITKLDSSTVGLAGRTGSGVVALATQWHADTGGTIPLLIVYCAYQGTSIEYWVNNRKGTYNPQDQSGGNDVTTLWGTSPTTGLAWFMAAAARYQATLIVHMHGTADTGNDGNVNASGKSYAQLLDELKAKFETLYAGVAVPPLYAIVPHQRSDDGPATWRMRSIQHQKAISGGTYRLAAWLLDWQMDLDGSPHQIDGATGNIRGGRRIGRGVARLLKDATLDIAGPQIVSAVRAANGAYVDVTFDRDIRTPGGATTGLPGWWVSADGVAWTNTANTTAAIVSARVLRLTPNSGTIAAGSRLDLLRGTPFASDLTVADCVGPIATVTATGDTTAGSTSVNITAISGTVSKGDSVSGAGIAGNSQLNGVGSGPGTYTLTSPATVTATGVALTISRTESLLEANYLSKVITDTTSFGNGRGMPASPVMGSGFAIAEAGQSAYTRVPKSSGSVTLTKAQAATLRVRDTGAARAVGISAEPISLRWERKTGDTTGRPNDGINAALTVA